MALTKLAVVQTHFAKLDPKILAVLATLDLATWFENRPSDDHFLNLTRNIIYQQLAGKAASTIFARFEKLVGKINPESILALSDQNLRDVGLSWAKVKYVKDLASKVQSGEVVLHNLDTLDNESVIAELMKVKGIGRWTGEMFLLFTLQRENIFSYGDLGLKKGFAKLYGIADPTLSEIKKVVDTWAPYQSYGSIALWHYLDNR